MIDLKLPVQNIVFQRGNDNSTRVPIVGNTTVELQARLVPTDGGQSTDNITLPPGEFNTSVVATGGNYTLELIGGTESLIVTNIGVGEVICFFGHSYLHASSDGGQKQAQSKLVRCPGKSPQNYDSDFSLDFVNLTTAQNVGPFGGGGPYFYGELGDAIVRRVGVPVLFYNCAFGGSQISESYKLLNGIPFPAPFSSPVPRHPLKPLEICLQNYIPVTGLRCMVVEHGYNDRGLGEEQFPKHLRFVLDHIRVAYNMPDLAYVLNIEDTIMGMSNIPALQRQVLSSYTNIYKGVDFNSQAWQNPSLRANNNHPSRGAGFTQLALDMDTALASVFTLAKPLFGESETAYPVESFASIVAQYETDQAAPIAQDTANLSVIIAACICLYFLIPGSENLKLARGAIVSILAASVYKLFKGSV